MKTITILLLSVFLFSCDNNPAVPEATGPEFTGAWGSTGAGIPILGDCCSFSFTATETNGIVTGIGTFTAPGARVGQSWTYPGVRISGTLDSAGRISLDLENGGGFAISYGWFRGSTTDECLFDYCFEGTLQFDGYWSRDHTIYQKTL